MNDGAMETNDGWGRQGFYVIKEMQRMSRVLDGISDKISEIERRQAIMEAQGASNAKWAGGIVGFITSAIVIVGGMLANIFTSGKH